MAPYSKRWWHIILLSWKANTYSDVNAILEPWRRDSTSASMPVPYETLIAEVQYQIQFQSELQLRCQCHHEGFWLSFDFNCSGNAILELWSRGPTANSLSMQNYLPSGRSTVSLLTPSCHSAFPSPFPLRFRVGRAFGELNWCRVTIQLNSSQDPINIDREVR